MPTRTDGFLELYPPEAHSWAGKVAFGFGYPTHGWIPLAVMATAYVQNLVIDCSNVFNPFPELIAWMENVAVGDFPCETSIDEEGLGKTLRATWLNEEEFLFEILRWPWLEHEARKRPTFIYVRVNRKQFLSEFLKQWDDFLERQYEPAHWEEYGSNLRALDVSQVRKFVQAMS